MARPLISFLKTATFNLGRVTTPALLEQWNVNIIATEADEKTWERSPDRVSEGFTYDCLNACFALGDDTRCHLGEITQPVLIQTGASDPIMQLANDAPSAVSNFTRLSASNDKASRVYAGNHDLLNDRNSRKRLLADALVWMNKHR